MLAEIGHLALILALAMAFFQATVPLWGAAKNNASLMAVAKTAAQGQFFFISIAFFVLVYSFVISDFSVAYVANNSNTHLPMLYKVSAVWGAHEGSLLLWGYTLVIWTNAVILFSASLPAKMVARVIAVLGMISIGFLLFMLLTSNPFDRLLPAALEGRDLNPLLQDPGLAFHPPMLYFGYVGFAVPFAFAIAAMMGGQLDAAWARWSRPWANIAWVFLTLGITLGSWWAYYELGWGGWWFWDPVENASFMPWLVGTALIHSLAVTEKRNAFKAWTVLLAILAFSLSLLGTFLVRSGVLTSVHAFATDPARGVFILIFLVLVIGGSLLLYAWRAPKIKTTAQFSLFSKETALLMNNVLLIVATGSILLGTLYPLLLDALGLGKISVGPPYFNSVFVPLMAPLAVLLGFGIFSRWKKDEPKRIFSEVKLTALASVVITALLSLTLPAFKLAAVIGLLLSVWVVLSAMRLFVSRINKNKSLSVALLEIPRSFYGMTLAHVGVAVFIVGITLTSLYSQEKDIRLEPGQMYQMGEYSFEFEGVTQIQGPNYTANQGRVKVRKGAQLLQIMQPQKRIYRVQKMPMTEAAINAGISRDLFVALGEPLDDKGAWSVRLYVKPFIRWIWIGAVIMALGGLLASTDGRYRRSAVRKKQHNKAGIKEATV
ncbi:MAG: heme lyase CcmF/NrfE family subunit [Gammaproteobacteria bacterium]|nr:heme lyase CcmF/NrfE family subunit [Gammaproteobacteria bacterium]